MRFTASCIFLASAVIGCGSSENTGSTSTGGAGGNVGGAGGTAGVGGSNPGGSGGSGGTTGGSGGVGALGGSGGNGGAPVPPQACDLSAPATYASPLGACDAGGWCWESPLPHGGHIWEMWGSASDGWLVANERTMHWNGTQWSATGAPGGTGIWGSAPNDVWLVGDSPQHYDGNTWTSVPELAGPSHIHGSAANNVWAFGYKQVLRFNGSTWSSVAAPNNTYPRDSWTSGPSSVWAVYIDDRLYRYNGASWQDVTPAGIQKVRTVWGSGPNDVWIGGSVNGDGAVYRFDGSGMSAVALPPTSGIRSISGTAANDVWLAGVGEVIHFDGSQFTVSPTTQGEDDLVEGLWSPAGSEPWLFASDGGTQYHLERWDGAVWASYGPELMTSVSDAWGSAWNDVWATGLGGVNHFDGSKWSVTELAPEYFNGIWGADAADVYAVTGQTLWHFDGTSWQNVASAPTFAPFVDVWGTGGDEIWIATDDSVLKWDDATLTPLPPPPVSPNKIWASSSGDIWVGGYGLAHFDGLAWTQATLPPDPFSFEIEALWGRSPTDVWAADTGNVYHFDGTSWQEVAGLTFGADAIWGCGTDTLFVDDSSDVYQLVNGSLEVVSETPGQFTYVLWGASENHLLSFGAGGAIIRRAK